MESMEEARRVDAHLVALARRGKAQAWDRLMERYYPLVLRGVTRATGDPERAADLTQETFLAVFRHLDQLSTPRSFRAWLYQIARRQVLRDQRRRRLRRLVSLEGLVAHGATGRPAHIPSPAVTVVQDRVRHALAALRPSLREALLLQLLWELSTAEIAEIQGSSLVAARKRIGRAKTQFRAAYQALPGGDDDPIL